MKVMSDYRNVQTGFEMCISRIQVQSIASTPTSVIFLLFIWIEWTVAEFLVSLFGTINGMERCRGTGLRAETPNSPDSREKLVPLASAYISRCTFLLLPLLANFHLVGLMLHTQLFMQSPLFSGSQMKGGGILVRTNCWKEKTSLSEYRSLLYEYIQWTTETNVVPYSLFCAFLQIM